MSDEIASEMLHKLEITTPAALGAATTQLGETLNLIDNTNLPLNLNPFYEDETLGKVSPVEDGPIVSNTTTMQRNQPGCRRCRLRRRSDSVADAYKSASMTLQNTTAESTDANCWTHSTLGIQRQPLKTRRGGGILRPPVLRKLQNLQKLLRVLPAAESEQPTTSATAAGSNAVGKPTSTNIVSTYSKSPGICDFRDLIDECQNLLQMENDVKGRFGLVSPQQRLKKNFTTMQLSSKLSGSLFNSKVETDRLNINDGTGQPVSNAATNLTRSNAAASTTCSQQAGHSAAAAVTVSNSSCGSGDDVTIDELASYFDTFVHIPKKMSTMAEMMYI